MTAYRRLNDLQKDAPKEFRALDNVLTRCDEAGKGKRGLMAPPCIAAWRRYFAT
jgi:hypothetical protein